MYRNCPECREDWNGKVCSACGFKASDKVKLAPLLCSDMSHGMQCSRAGVVSGGVHGGPFYCWQHAPGALRGEHRTIEPEPEPHSSTLTERQWYAVCKFFPKVARRCSRPFADVSPDNPLDAEVKLSPMLAGLSEAARERQAIVEESAGSNSQL